MSNEELRPETGEPSSPESDDNSNSQASKPRPKSGGRSGWIIALVVGIVVGALVIVFAIRGSTRQDSTDRADSGSAPVASPAEVVCPKRSTKLKSPAPLASDGRVHGGKLSYPRLGEPWSIPISDPNVPFGRDFSLQRVVTEAEYQPDRNWMASVRVGQLVSEDGFSSLKQASEVMTKCILGAFYNNGGVTRKDVSEKATKIDGHDAWLVKMHLGLHIERLKAQQETALMVIVETGEDELHMYFASIPDNAPPEVLKTAESLIGKLKVDA